MAPTKKQLPTVQGNVLDRFLDAADRAGIHGNGSKARQWYLTKAKTIASPNTLPSKLLKDMEGKFVQRAYIGRMYMFLYDPKHQATLPFYDRFPLIICINDAVTDKNGNLKKDRFMGINLHYLPPRARAALLAKLYDLASSQTMDERTKLRISYQVLRSAAKFKMFKPCVKVYLKAHVRSRFVKVDADEWLAAIALPVEQFEKASRQQVWSHSKKQYS